MHFKIDGLTDPMVMCGDKKMWDVGLVSKISNGGNYKNRIVEHIFLFELPVFTQKNYIAF